MIDILPEIIVTASALIFGSFVLSSAGFGIAIAASPLMLIILDAKTTVVVINTVSLAVFIFMIVQNRSQVRFREMMWPISFGILGVPLGLLILDFISSTLLGISISALIIGLGIYVGFYRSHTFISNPFSFNLISFVVGALLTSTGIGGPLMAIAAVSRNWERDSLRGSLGQEPMSKKPASKRAQVPRTMALLIRSQWPLSSLQASSRWGNSGNSIWRIRTPTRARP